MKKLFTTLVLVSLSVFTFAGIITVDNRIGSGANYTTVASAISNAIIGDTIYIHPSSVSYGAFTVNKQLVFIGPGHHPEYTGGTGATTETITIHTGASGSIFQGLIIQSITCYVWSQVNNIEVSNNYFGLHQAIKGSYGDNAQSHSWLIQGNIFTESLGCGGCSLIDINSGSTNPNSNWIIRNNFIQTKNSQNNTHIFNYLNSTIIVENNIILHNNTSPIFGDDGIGGELRNNIIYVTNENFTDLTVNALNVIFSHNLTYHTSSSLAILPGAENMDNVNPDFETIPAENPAWNYSNNYMLSTTSPGHNAGTDGTDIGIYGTNFPFRMEGYPQDFPRIQSIQVSNTIVPVGGTMEINLKAIRAGY